jgi:hypothetical protein
MAKWQVSTKEKKSVEEHELWEKDGLVIRRVNGFRYGTWIVDTEDDELPEFERTTVPGGDDAEDSINMYETNYETELVSLDDGWYGNVIWPEDIDEEERERLEALWEESWYDGWEGESWIQTETECWVWGELEIKPSE